MNRMNTISKAITVYFFLTAGLSASKTQEEALNSNNDHGIWLLQEVSKRINSNCSISFNTEERFGSNYRLYYYQRYESFLFYDFSEQIKENFNICPQDLLSKFTLGIGYAQLNRIQRNPKGNFHWVGVSRPEIELEAGFRWKGWQLKQRIRGQYIKHNSSHYKNFADLRIRLTLDFPWSFTAWKITPYIQNEFFFRKNSYHKTNPNGLVGVFFEDRFRIGVSLMPIEDRLRSEIYWQWRPLKQPPGTKPLWFNTYNFGINFTLLF